MNRRKFIQGFTALTGGLIFARSLPAAILAGEEKKLTGRVLSNGKGLKGVIISDGYSVVATDKNGRYEFDAHPDAMHVFMSTPAGYAFKHESGISRHYYSINETNIDFHLTKLKQDDNEHQFIIWADPQVKNASDVEKMMNQSVPDVKKFV